MPLIPRYLAPEPKQLGYRSSEPGHREAQGLHYRAGPGVRRWGRL